LNFIGATWFRLLNAALMTGAAAMQWDNWLAFGQLRADYPAAPFHTPPHALALAIVNTLAAAGLWLLAYWSAAK